MSVHGALALVEQIPHLHALANRRAHERVSPEELSWLTEVRIKYGPAVSLIDLSPGGAQIETVNHRLEPGRLVVIEIDGETGALSIPSRVVRCGVSGIIPDIKFRGALQFKETFDMPQASLRERRAALFEQHAKKAATVRHLALVAPVAAPPPSVVSAALATAREMFQPSLTPPTALVGWHRLVVRYRDGRMLKGFGRDFLPGKGEVHVWPATDAPIAARISVRLTHLKAVFFVHDFAGASEVEPPVNAVEPGRRIVVTFGDGEVLEGTTLNYSSHAPGFFVTPADVKTNNQRVFVIAESVHHVRFP